jgi:hypothetical protein
MERVVTLCNLLTEKLQNKASINDLLSTVKMMESELLHLKNITPTPTVVEHSIAAVNISSQRVDERESENKLDIEEPKIVEVLLVDEAEIEAELDAIRANVAQINHLSYTNKQPISFDAVEEVPTLANRQSIFAAKETNAAIKELNELFPTENDNTLNDKFVTEVNEVGEIFSDTPAKELNDILAQNSKTSLNDQLANTQDIEKNINVDSTKEMNKEIIGMEDKQVESRNINATTVVKEFNEVLPSDNGISLNDKLNIPQTQLSDNLMDEPIKDLKKAIGVNDRFLYLNELFRGDEAMYERSIKTINAFNVYPEAELWIRRELKLKLGWDEKYQTVKQFDQLIKRRFA